MEGNRPLTHLPPPATKPVNCSVCGKEIKSFPRREFTLSGLTFRVNLEMATQEQREYVERQFGPYSPDQVYEVCIECHLRALGIPEPKPAGEKETEENENSG